MMANMTRLNLSLCSTCEGDEAYAFFRLPSASMPGILNSTVWHATTSYTRNVSRVPLQQQQQHPERTALKLYRLLTSSYPDGDLVVLIRTTLRGAAPGSVTTQFARPEDETRCNTTAAAGAAAAPAREQQLGTARWVRTHF